MNTRLDETHDAGLGSWVPSARPGATDFPLQNLPLGVFRRKGGEPRTGVAIGDLVLDLPGALAASCLPGLPAQVQDALREPVLNPLMALGREAAAAVRRAAHGLLRADSGLARPPGQCLAAREEVEMLLPAFIGDYTDFYASIDHARNVGSMLRPEQPLFPNYQWVPIGYHGRASSIVPSGTPIRRPQGQTMAEGATTPVLGPTRSLDYECEVAAWVGPGNRLGEPVPISEAERHLFGFSLLNDWSARDVQRWEYQPLGPFLAKNFATTVSPWIVTMDALEPFRVPAAARSPGEAEPLPYLADPGDRARGAVGVEVEVLLSSEAMRRSGMDPIRLSRAAFAGMYWTPAQLLTHHASNGCNLRSGDVLGSGTVSGPEKSARGCLLELTWRGTEPLSLPSGETRRFLEDGDEVILRGRCARPGFAPIGFGECRGVVVPARP